MCFLLICVCHLFWNNLIRDCECLEVITNIIDFTLVSSAFDSSQFRIVLCGDFNGFHDHYNEISRVTRLKSVVNSPTGAPVSLIRFSLTSCKSARAQFFLLLERLIIRCTD